MAKQTDKKSKSSKNSNKNSVSKARNRQRTEQEIMRARREARHKRRVRSTILCWMLLVILIAAAVVGVMFAGHKISDIVMQKNKEKAEKVQQAQEKEAQETEDKDKEEEKDGDSEEPEEYTEEDLLDDMIATCIGDMGLEERVAGLIFAIPEDLMGADKVVKAGDATEAALSTIPVGGIVYHSNNVENENQFSSMLIDTIDRSKYPLFLVLNEDTDALNNEALTEYGINFDLGKNEESGKTVTGSSLPEDNSLNSLKVLVLDGSAEDIAEEMKAGLEDGVDMFYITKNVSDAYGKFLDLVKTDDEIKGKIDAALENVYKIKYSGRLSE